jgi:hypothetical protein
MWVGFGFDFAAILEWLEQPAPKLAHGWVVPETTAATFNNANLHRNLHMYGWCQKTCQFILSFSVIRKLWPFSTRNAHHINQRTQQVDPIFRANQSGTDLANRCTKHTPAADPPCSTNASAAGGAF